MPIMNVEIYEAFKELGASEETAKKAGTTFEEKEDQLISIEINDKKAFEWYQKAAEQDHAVAQYFLGLLYYKGEGIPQNYEKAYFWFSIATAHGDDEAANKRDIVIEAMTSQQIATAREEAQRWFEQHQ